MKIATGKISASLLFLVGSLTAGAVAQTMPDASPQARQTAMAPLTGNASVNTALAVRLLQAAETANQQRLYKEAEKKYQAVIKEIYRGYHDPKAMCLARIGLAELALRANEDPEKSAKLLSSCVTLCQTSFGADSTEMARLYFDSAEAALAEHKIDKALSFGRQSLAIRNGKDPESHETGLSLALMARIEHAAGNHKEALETFSKALTILEEKPGLEMYDYAKALYASGITRMAAGDEAGATAAIEKALGMLDTVISLNKTPERRGVVHYAWSDGVPECRQVYDSMYPLRYVIIDKLRVAVTLVRSDKHVGAIVSLANCSKEPMQVAVGPVIVEKTSPGSRSKMFYCDPALIDVPLEEECVSNLTWRKRWLCHIQKTHRTPGYLKSGALDPDNFYGNNLFGTYGSWDGSLRHAPPIVTREQFYFDNEKTLSYNDVERFMARSTGGYKPALIDPGDARTGVVFFLRQRYETARVRVMIGNAVVDFPFQAVATHSH